MKFKGRNGGLAIEMRNHIIATRIWVISLLILSIPTIIFVCINNPYFYIDLPEYPKKKPGFCGKRGLDK